MDAFQEEERVRQRIHERTQKATDGMSPVMGLLVEVLAGDTYGLAKRMYNYGARVAAPRSSRIVRDEEDE